MLPDRNIQEIRDPIHNFIHFDRDERRVINSRPVQRLRYIHQLALTYLIYPGATHRRFEHSLGVMELAGRVFDVLTNAENLTDDIRAMLPALADPSALAYWRKVLRIAALIHDIGHLPFSHAAEKELLPTGFSHEDMTRKLILSQEMRDIWKRLTPPLRSDDIVKLALGPKEMPSDGVFDDWEAVLAEIITGDSFGVDRMDYLLRDSHHAGVAYGKFDHFRLIETLRILRPPETPNRGTEQLLLSPDMAPNVESSKEPMLGILHGGINAAEGLLLARYFMYTQVYFHANRVVYNLHLLAFLKQWLPSGLFSTTPSKHLAVTDNEVTTAMLRAVADKRNSGHKEALKIINRAHFKTLYQRNPDDFSKNPDALKRISEGAKLEFGEENILSYEYTETGGAPEFPVLMKDGGRYSSLVLSGLLERLPVLAVGFIFISPKLKKQGTDWLVSNRANLIK